MESSDLHMRDDQDGHDDEDRDEDVGQVPEGLLDGVVTEERQYELDEYCPGQDSDLQWIADTDPGLLEHRRGEEHHEDQPQDLVAFLGNPVEEGRDVVALPPEYRPADDHRRRTRLRALDAGGANGQIGKVADQDDSDRLIEGEAERDDQCPVDEEFHVEDGSGPHPEQPDRRHGLLRCGNDLDAPLLRLEEAPSWSDGTDRGVYRHGDSFQATGHIATGIFAFGGLTTTSAWPVDWSRSGVIGDTLRFLDNGQAHVGTPTTCILSNAVKRHQGQRS